MFSYLFCITHTPYIEKKRGNGESKASLRTYTKEENEIHSIIISVFFFGFQFYLTQTYGEKKSIELLLFVNIQINTPIMATSTTTRHIHVSSSTPIRRNNEKPIQLNPIDQTNVNTESMSSIANAGVPVKFADNLFSVVGRK